MLPLDKLIYKDFAGWKIENQQTFELFQQNRNVIYDRLEPIYVVLNHIYDMVVEGHEIDEDHEVIFETGFQYISNQFEVIKIYFDTLFQQNCDDFIEFSEMILYLFYISDVRNDLESNGIDFDHEILDDIETTIENMIMERRKELVYASDLVNKAFEKIFEDIDYHYVGIVDIFVEIAETLGIFLYEDDELVLGEEI
jgi:hypothetical protein